jgi:superfamily II DNA or RNA helicase
MASKFFLPFGRALSGGTVRHEYIHPVEKTEISQNLYQPDLCIASTGLLGRKERLRDIKTAKDFDIVLVDEAHYARRKDHRNGCRSHPQFGHLYRTLRDHVRQKTRSLWMATATPMQLDWIEVFDLLQLTHRVGPFLYDPSLTWAYYEALGSLVENRNIDSSRWELLRRCINTVKRLDPFLNAYLNEWVIDGRMRSSAKRWLESGHIPTGADRRHIQRLVFSAAPLCRVMLRHTRPLLELYRENGQLKANLAKRRILPFPIITMTLQEKTSYEELEAYCKELTKQITVNSPGQKNLTHLGFYLSFLRLRFASSLFAIRETLRRRKIRVEATLEHSHENGEPAAESDELKEFLFEDQDTDEDVVEKILINRTPKDLEWERDRLTEMLKTLDDISGTPSKMKELLRVLNKRRQGGSRIQQTVIFTRFYDTLQDIVDRLRAIDPSMLIGTYSGRGGQYVDPKTKALRGIERDEIKHRFLRGEIDVLVCTDAAAEGLNLQTADLLINYDLPWNPMKVEQRIGRIDRIGQKYEKIFVLNLCYVDSAEQIVYDRLLKRLAEAGVVVGTQQPSLLPVTLDEFCELAERKLTIDALEARAKERIIANRRRTESMEIAARDLYEIYIRSKDQKKGKPAPITLDAIWEALSSSKYLRDLGSTVASNPADKVIVLRGFDSLPSGAQLTVNRDIFEKGLPASDSSAWPLHFATYGDTVFEALLEELGCYELPPCAVQLSEPVPDIPVEVIAYAVAKFDENGSKALILVTSWEDLNGLALDESAVIDPADLEPLREELRRIIRNEFDPMRAVGRIEKENLRAGIAGAIWNLLVAQSLLRPIGYSEDDNFWARIKDIDSIIEERDQLLVAGLPAEFLKTIKDELILDINIPRVGDKADITAPIAYARAGIDAGYRIADAMKERRAELSLGRVQARIERELKDQIKHLQSIW